MQSRRGAVQARFDELFDEAERQSSTWFVHVPFTLLTWSHSAAGHLMMLMWLQVRVAEVGDNQPEWLDSSS